MTVPVSRAESQRKTRARLLEAAAVVFTSQGYGGASVDDILTVAGLSKGAMYANFTSKEALFLALLDQCLADQLQAMRLILARPAPLDLRIAAIGEWAPNFVEDPRGWRLLSTEFWLHAARNPALQPELASRYAVQRQDVARLIEEGYTTVGQLPPLPYLELASVVIGMVNGLSIQQVIDPVAITNQLYPSALSLILNFSNANKPLDNETLDNNGK